MQNKKGFAKLIAITTLFIAILFQSCSPYSSISETATVYIETNQKNIAVSSISPIQPTIVKYKVELFQDEKSQYPDDFIFDNEYDIVLEGVRIGTYDIKITGYSDSEMQTPVVEGIKTNATIYPDNKGSNTFDITLSFLSQGKGSISLIISWDKLTATGNLIDDAIKRGSLGFLAFKAEDDMPLSGNATPEQIEDRIIWASNPATNKSVEYTESGLDANKTGEEIYFRIYSEIDGVITVIAETFHSVLQVYPNLESVPDVNDKYNFSLSNDNIIGYLKNVINPVATATSDTELSITWTNPTFTDDLYPITVNVKAKDNETGRIIAGTPVTYSNATEAAEGGQTSISDLSSESVYSILFQINAQIGYSAETALISDAHPKIPVSSIEFAISDSEFTMGDSVEISAKITPDTATNKDFTIAEKSDNPSVEINDKKVTFKAAGEYTLVITSADNPAKSTEESFTVKLSVPTKIEITSVSHEGVKLLWNTVTGATEYVVKRTSGTDEVKEFITHDTTFIDQTISTGNTYSYTVRARLNNEEKFDSVESDSTNSVSIKEADINIEIPQLNSPDFSNVFDEYNGIIINDENPEITINLSNEIPGATKYIWKMNGTLIKEGSYKEASYIEINKSTPGLDLNRYESSNNLVLEVLIEGSLYSGKLSVIYSSPNPTTIEFSDIKTEDNNNTITYGENETIVAEFKSGSGFVTWSSDKPSVISVDKYTGEIEAKTDGKATITATLISDETKSISKEFVSYIPAIGITIEQPERDFMISSKKLGAGVEIYDSSLTTIQLNAIVAAANDIEKGHSGTIEWKSNDESIVKVSSDGTLTPVVSGTTTITASIDGKTSNAVSVYVLDADIKLEGEKVAGTSLVVSGVGNKERDIILSFTYNNNGKEINYFNSENWNESGYINYWCFDRNIDLKEKTNLGKIIITSNDFSGILQRKANTADHLVTSVIKIKDESVNAKDQKNAIILYFTAEP